MTWCWGTTIGWATLTRRGENLLIGPGETGNTKKNIVVLIGSMNQGKLKEAKKISTDNQTRTWTPSPRWKRRRRIVFKRMESNQF